MKIPFLISLISCLLTYHTLSAKVTMIREGHGVSLQQVINDAAAGDSIIIEGGRYKEGKIITVDKPLFIIGINNPVIDGENKYEIMEITSDFVIIQGLHFLNSGKSGYEDIAALRILNSGNILIRDNFFENCFFGIYGQHAGHTTIANNTFRANGFDEISSANGIHCWKSEHMLIINNRISGHRDGIYFEFVTESTIRGNISTGNVRYGLHFMFSHNNWYLGNSFTDNGAGVAVMYSKGVHMHKNIFSRNWGNAAYGILMKDISDSRVENNIFSHNTASIYMEGSSRITIRHNQFKNNGWAVKIQASCIDNIINENNFSGNTFDIATNGSLQLNNFTGNYWDKYEGYDLDRDGTGDIPFRPVSIFSMIVERNPATLMMFRSFMVGLMDKAEKVFPGITPEALKDDKPFIRPLAFNPPTI
ncbi:MAG TPA: nitrous oxide reductase family maturation protein NosD [Chitinophagaceae bacterium]|nr:nitrous oxide reductase family maturation protein NosD [Chitinophagaceae bacterium]